MENPTIQPVPHHPGTDVAPPKPRAVASPAQPVAPVAARARLRARHFGLILSFLLMVLIPSGLTFAYMDRIAADQYASTVGFSVRTEEAGSPMELLGGITGVSSGSSSDTDILYEFIQSQNLVTRVDNQINLRAMFSKPEFDPVFAFNDPGSIEDLVDYWGRMVKIFYDSATGLIEVRVTAFAAQDAQDIARIIFSESSLMINQLSAIARSDATRYAQDDLNVAVERLKIARQNVARFRNDNQIVDPSADIQGQMGLLNTLQQQLAESVIEQDLLRETAGANDPRIEQAGRRIAVIEARIVEERKKFGVSDASGSAFSTLITEYEGLSVEREFAEQSYLSTLSAFDIARAEAQRQSRYLAAYVEPTLAETSIYPKRLTIFGLVTVFLFLIWSILALVAYSIKDRR